MSSTKKDQDKAIFTLKKDSEGNVLVSKISGQNGGEIRGSIQRTNSGKSFLVAGKGIKILSGSNTGYPGPGQVQIEVDLNEVSDDLKSIVGLLGVGSTAGERGRTGATGPQGIPGPPGVPGSPGAAITGVVSNADGTLTISYGDGQSIQTVSLKGDQGDPGPPGNNGNNGNDGAPGAGFVSGDKLTSDIVIFSSIETVLDTTSEPVTDGTKTFGRALFRYTDHISNSLNTEWFWSIIGQYKHMASSTITTPSSLNFTLQYLDAVGTWQTIHTSTEPNQIDEWNTGSNTLNYIANITADIQDPARLTSLSNTQFRVSYSAIPGTDDSGQSVEVEVGFRSSKVFAVYTYS